MQLLLLMADSEEKLKEPLDKVIEDSPLTVRKQIIILSVSCILGM